MTKRRTVYYTLFSLGLFAALLYGGISFSHNTWFGGSKESLSQKKDPMLEFFSLPSGLKYSILQHGSSELTPPPGSTVTVHYTGWLSEGGEPGRQFDSSKDRGPFSFVVGSGSVIKGWDEALLQMKVGEKWRLIIPPSLGYGAYGYPGVIPGNATLIFDVELISFK